ncbi:hypothetical protein OB955_22305 [Halobacteria archaeon AArc-m2/3/4]|uniref:Uncharacterized protein n=1 Tax=Natronoglomus mannanivorans TaxID=2979990 RepID=A0ABT2QKG0_9EURY|nr:hypothetical protein [Halobacteria archaeon AArc-m2/3/4]
MQSDEFFHLIYFETRTAIPRVAGSAFAESGPVAYPDDELEFTIRSRPSTRHTW